MRMKNKLIIAGIGTLLLLTAIGWCVFMEVTTPPDPQVMYFPTRGVSMQTVVGYPNPGLPPWPEGNSLSLALEPGDPSKCIYQVLNMHAENFGRLYQYFGLTNVRARLVSNTAGNNHFIIITDPRIPRNWFLRDPGKHGADSFGK
ncbi:MAG TPA: hypothetical protein PLN21_06675 [Gemmatales bacterium]|nr:hypothetical protein [Gemmatales bacterium]